MLRCPQAEIQQNITNISMVHLVIKLTSIWRNFERIRNRIYLNPKHKDWILEVEVQVSMMIIWQEKPQVCDKQNGKVPTYEDLLANFTIKPVLIPNQEVGSSKHCSSG